jgi:aspartate/methionine/tyrosine aminotransferase
MELDNLFQPKVSLLAPHEMSDPSPLVLQAFVKQARANPQRWYLIDDSANFDIASELRSNIMLRMLGETQLPPNLVFIYGLIKNTVCPDLQLSFMINPPDSWIHGLDVAAELSYSRIAYPSQLYYEWLLDEMLAFPFPDDATQPLPPLVAPASSLSTEFIKIAGDAVFAEKPVDVENDDVIRLDYGEFEAPVPNGIVRGLIKGFLEPGSANELGKLVTSRVAAYMKFTRYVTVSEQQVVLGQGAFPLLGNLIQAMKARLGRPPVVALPQGSYGPVFPLIQYHGGQVALIETQADQGFLITLQALARMSEKPDLLWLTQPNNPSGLYFEHDTVAGIVQLCAERGIYLLADEIFFLLSDPKLGAWTPPHLSFGSALSSSESKWVFIVDGLSKSFAAGGLRSGFMICPDEQWAHEIQSMSLLPPASTLRAWDSLYSVFLEQAPHQMMNLPEELEHVENYLASARSMLADQRDSLLALLASHGLDDGLDNAKRGGLFVLARLGDKAADLARKEKLLINPPEWARTPGWCRVCFSLEPARFHAAMQRLQRYLG